MSRRRISCQGKKDFVVRQKIVGLQMFSTASLKFGDSWENFGDKKKIGQCKTHTADCRLQTADQG